MCYITSWDIIWIVFLLHAWAYHLVLIFLPLHLLPECRISCLKIRELTELNHSLALTDIMWLLAWSVAAKDKETSCFFLSSCAAVCSSHCFRWSMKDVSAWWTSKWMVYNSTLSVGADIDQTSLFTLPFLFWVWKYTTVILFYIFLVLLVSQSLYLVVFTCMYNTSLKIFVCFYLSIHCVILINQLNLDICCRK
jgi:hypothetical protein